MEPGTLLPSPGQMAREAVRKAEENLGVLEEGHNAGHAVQTYLASVGLPPGHPWCAAHAYYRLWRAAGSPADYVLPRGFPRTGYTPDMVAWAKKEGLWIPRREVVSGRRKICRGDWAFFYFPSLRRIAHVGMVASSFPGGFLSIEGNTSPDTEVEREGQGLFRKHRLLKDLGQWGGFVRIPF